MLDTAVAPAAALTANVVLPLVASVDIATPGSLGEGLGLGLDLFGGGGDMDSRMNGGGDMDSRMNYEDEERLGRQARAAAASTRRLVRRDRSRSRGRELVPPLFWIPVGESFGEAMRSLVAVRRPDSVPLVDLTDGVTSLEAALLICGRRVRAESFCFYIGITECPSRRFEMHQAAGSWARMVVLCKARSSRETAFLERALIKEHLDRLNLRCTNFGPGGECASAGSPHFLYLLIGHSNLLRGSR